MYMTYFLRIQHLKGENLARNCYLNLHLNTILPLIKSWIFFKDRIHMTQQPWRCYPKLLPKRKLNSVRTKLWINNARSNILKITFLFSLSLRSKQTSNFMIWRSLRFKLFNFFIMFNWAVVVPDSAFFNKHGIFTLKKIKRYYNILIFFSKRSLLANVSSCKKQ